ncbi:hypothetical protein PXK56_18060 [Phaeobacter gallaeciensis]|uniref:hypothetical protein n=1 Tax=Phaeobacter gallaeciensis TaxID=60890 RepID=UPI002380C1B7|nr:hypothetical protein [Phaeobacter gallaeciensis]MDE4297095.1 hypothetical protein [Phaeobacter gallaeciensis]
MPASAAQTEQDTLRSFFDRRHPMYGDMVTHWKFLEASYKGGRAWFENNLFKYLKEGDKEFTDRKERAYRFNHTREVVELVQKYLFKAAISRNDEDAPEEVKTFWKSAMLNGFDIGQLMRQTSVKSSIGGRIALVVDNTLDEKLDSEGNVLPASVAETEGARVYAYAVPAQDVLDYAWDEDGDGELLWIKLREWVRDDADPIKSSGDVEERIRLWTREGWVLYHESEEKIRKGRSVTYKVEEVASGTHGLGMVPVRLVDHTVSSDPYHCPGLIDDIAYLDRAIANYLSNLDAIIQDQTFSQLAIPAQAIQRGDDMYQKVLDMGTKRIFVYDSGQGSSAVPHFLAPDPKQAGVILTVINKIINEIYHTVGLAGERTKEDNAVGIDNSSGVAKAYDFERVNSLLLSKATSCEAAENWLVMMVMAWHGKDFQEKLVTYPTTFDVMRLVDDLVTAEALQKIDAPDEMRREQLRMMIDKIFPQLKKEIKDRILQDIEAWKSTPDPAEMPKPSGNKPAAAASRQGSVTKDTPSKEDAKEPAKSS